MGLGRRIGKAMNSGKAWLVYVAAVVGAVGVLYGYYDRLNLPRPLWKQELSTALTDFGKTYIEPIGTKIDGTARSMSDLKFDLERAHGREQALQVEVGNLKRSVDRLERLTDRLFGAASPPPGTVLRVEPGAAAPLQ